MASAWYVLHTYSGHENRVKVNLEQRVRAMGMDGSIEQIFVPTQEVTEIKNGKKKVSMKTSFPGYVLIKVKLEEISDGNGENAKLNNDLWYVVKNTPGVMGFVGTSTHPTPLADQEVEGIISGNMGETGEEAKHIIDFAVGDKVKVVDGPFTGFSGVIDEINEEKSKLRLMISIFGRSTPVELEFFQIEKAQE